MNVLIAKDSYIGIDNYLKMLDYLNLNYQIYKDNIDINNFDMLLIPGGIDVDPSLYGQTKDKSIKNTNINLDHLQLNLIDKFVSANKPIFGICRGLQIINVYFKGTLIQDIKSTITHTPTIVGGKIIDSYHNITNSDFMAELFTKTCLVNSSHHQAIDKMGNGLIAVSHCEDNIIEAIRHQTLPIYAVQWHPERTILTYKKDNLMDGSKLLKYIISKTNE